MKTITLFLIILSFSFSSSIAQTKNSELLIYKGKVKAFARINDDFTNTLVDTLVNQTRTILINSRDSVIEIGWQLENQNPTLFHMTYKIEKKYMGTITDQKTQLQSDSYNYLMFDSENFPLMIVMALDKSYCNIYYFWDSGRKAFQKSEKVTFQ